MIPKRVFFYWGNETMSWLRYMTLKSFKRLNPAWDITLYVTKQSAKHSQWRSSEQQDFERFTGKDYMPQVADLGIKIQEWDIDIPNKEKLGPSHLSNFVKWYELAHNGGIYADMDILWVRPFKPIYKRFSYADAMLAITRYASIGLLGASPSNAFFRAIYYSAIKNWTPSRYQCAGVEALYRLLYGPGVFKGNGEIDWCRLYTHNIYDDIANRWKELVLYNLPMQIVYPHTNLNVNTIFSGLTLKDLPSDTVGLHWYAGAPLAQHYNNILDAEHPGPFRGLLEC